MALPSYLMGANEDQSAIRDPRFQYDVFGHIVQKPYETTSRLNTDDALFKELSEKYKYVQPDLQPNAGQEGVGYDIKKNPYGSFDMGGGLYLVPKQDQRYLLNDSNPLQEGTFGFLQQLNSKTAPTNPDGTLNKDGWTVMKSGNAMQGVMGTLGVLGAAAGSALWGPTGGLTTDLTGSFDGLMTGALQTAGGSGVASGASGLLGGVEGEWTPINGDAGLNNYVNSGINTNYNNFGLGSLEGISGDAGLNGYTGSVLDGVNIGNGTYSGVPDADTSYNTTSNTNTNDLLKNASKLLNNSSGQGQQGGVSQGGMQGGQAKSIEASSPYNTPVKSLPVAYAAYLANKGLLG
jgi:hypothetical protein